MAVMPSIQWFSRKCKILVNEKYVVTVKLFLRSLISKVLVDFKASELSQLDHFLIYCPFNWGGYALWTSKRCLCPRTRGVRL